MGARLEMNLAGKTRIGLVLSLGVLAGLGLIVLPGIVAVPPAHNTTSTIGSSNSTSTANPGPRTSSGTNNSSGTVLIIHVNSTTTTQFSGPVYVLAANSTTVKFLVLNSTTTHTRANPDTVVQSAGDSRITPGGASWLFVVIVVPAVAISLFVSFAVSRWGRRSPGSDVEFDEPIFDSLSEE